MNTHKLKLYAGLICMSLLLPLTSSAYFTTNQTATRITKSSILYTVTYEFGLPTRDLLMPILAERENKTPDTLGFTILDEDSQSDVGTALGLVLTNDEDVSIKDGKYFLPAGESAVFTLMTILDVSDVSPESDLDLSLRVSNLPFTMVIDDAYHQNGLNESELQYYKTPSVKLLD